MAILDGACGADEAEEADIEAEVDALDLGRWEREYDAP